jgi:hypothetical protein
MQISRFSMHVSAMSVLLVAFVAPGAKAQEAGHDVCRSIGGYTPEQLGDRENHVLTFFQDSCQTTEGPAAGAVYNDTGVIEWDGPHGKELSGFGVGRKPGATQAFQDLDGQVEVTMVDGKPTGWIATGHSIVTLATGTLTPLLGKTVSWTGKSTGPNVFELDYTFK